MENEIKSLLKDNENLLWCGKPEPFKTNDVEYKAKVRTSIIFWAIVWGIVEACYIPIAVSLNKGIAVIAFLLITAVCGAFVVSKIGEGNKVRNLTYALTDKNMIIKGKTTKICPYELVKYSDFEIDKAGTTSLICGAQTDHIGREIDPRSLTLLCMRGGLKGDNLADAFAMYSISQDAVDIMKKYLPIGNRY